MAEHTEQRQESEERQEPETAETPLRFLETLKKWREIETTQKVDCVRLVLIGKTGVGKSATGNTILGKKEFESSGLAPSVTKECEKKTGLIGSRQVQVIDTPGLFDTTVSNEKIREEIGKCITMSSPGPHVFLLLVSVGRFTQEEREAVKMIQEIFGEYSKAYTMVGFTRGETLKEEEQNIETYIEKSPVALQELIEDCSGRYHVFCNKDKDTQAQQVMSLLEKIDRMIQQNGGSYTIAMFKETEQRIKAREMSLLQQKIEELEQNFSFLVREISKNTLFLEKEHRKQCGEAVKERDEEMKRLEEKRNSEKRINELDHEMITEFARSRHNIRIRAERAEANAWANRLKHNLQNCTIF